MRSNSVNVISRKNFSLRIFCPTDSEFCVSLSSSFFHFSLSVTFLRTRSGESLLTSRAVYSCLCHRPIIRRCSFNQTLSSSWPQNCSITISIGPGPIKTMSSHIFTSSIIQSENLVYFNYLRPGKKGYLKYFHRYSKFYMTLIVQSII